MRSHRRALSPTYQTTFSIGHNTDTPRSTQRPPLQMHYSPKYKNTSIREIKESMHSFHDHDIINHLLLSPKATGRKDRDDIDFSKTRLSGGMPSQQKKVGAETAF